MGAIGMRIFQNFPEAFDEIKRDLGEMGLNIRTNTMQDKKITGDEDYTTKELMNYIYTVTDPQFEDLNPTQPWADAEWEERFGGIEYSPDDLRNPGLAWKKRPDIWYEFIQCNGTFSYTYAERFNKDQQVKSVVDALKRDPNNRQSYIAMWLPSDSCKLGKQRVPCSLGWHFMYREEALHMTYYMRSCDFATHFQNDIYLSLKLQEYVAYNVGMDRGRFTHSISSLHIYAKDVESVF